MKFYRQWDATERPQKVIDLGFSATIPNQCLSMRKTIEKMTAGNFFGLSYSVVEFDSDIEGYDLNTPIFIDRSDPLTSFDQISTTSKNLSESLKKILEAQEAAKLLEAPAPAAPAPAAPAAPAP